MYYGFHFKSDAGVEVQFRINSADQAIYCRTSPSGGEWSTWRRLDVERTISGELKGSAEESLHAKRADTADRLHREMKITFQGDVAGEVVFDGSQNVVCNLAIDPSRLRALINDWYQESFPEPEEDRDSS